MRVVEAAGCRDELHALGWILTVLPAWEAARSNASGDPVDVACIATVGWILRQVAHSRWSRHPEWTPDFHPQAITPANPMEASR
ncbi:hypothetical protein [Streptomyces sp. NPDC127038]|uniref:hypothetical protein n=1 Tax=Streptomyces sp. NPDC127038 TaxID=3347114 RepID=UPI0036669F24